MLRWFQALMPKEEGFFPLFSRHAELTVLGARALADLLDGKAPIAECAATISQREAEADAITGEVMQAVRRTFITPFDRGDIQDLIGLLDDAIDQMQKTAKAITLFEVTAFTPQMREMGQVIVQAAERTAEAVGLLKAMQQNAAKLNSLTEEIVRIEERSDDLYDEGIKALFLASRDGRAMDYITGAEIYDHLEKVVDRLQDVANRISGILIEHL